MGDSAPSRPLHFYQHFQYDISIISRVAIQSIQRKWVLEQSCRLAHLSVCPVDDLWKNG